LTDKLKENRLKNYMKRTENKAEEKGVGAEPLANRPFFFRHFLFFKLCFCGKVAICNTLYLLYTTLYLLCKTLVVGRELILNES
jgi:hypothetical protein